MKVDTTLEYTLPTAAGLAKVKFEQAGGETVKQIIDEHPRLTKKGIYAALAFASEALRADVVYPIQVERIEG